MKIIRHGYESKNPTIDNSTTNRNMLQRELGDLLYAIDLMDNQKDITWSNLRQHQENKAQRVNKYLHYNKV